ncbi:MAG TPA: sodium-translocating pyrophosphatase [Chthoniobacteraceae bacterium]|jgi:K(+)-stimulated pyrophosphate-energized sodium pump|nr:sodium-translocating pyrophosphatase [Chthoniobacteraceae bacterium]
MHTSSRSFIFRVIAAIFAVIGISQSAFAGEADLALPVDRATVFHLPGINLDGGAILWIGMAVCACGLLYGLLGYLHLRKLPAHQSMLDVSRLIYSTCKTYLLQQGQLLLLLEVLIAGTMIYYFGYLKALPAPTVVLILAWSLAGIGGSFLVAWFGMLINNVANSRMAFAALRGNPRDVSEIPTRSGMSIGVLLISVELLMMLSVLKFVPAALAGYCFVGFAIGESLGASVLRICGGIFTKIADIGSDMMKIVFGIKEDDARNPGVIADCAGDNAGDSVGPTADGFETYGVTGVALITFILLAVKPENQWTFIIWIFAMRIIMVPASMLAWVINRYLVNRRPVGEGRFNFEYPLTALIWTTSLICLGVSFIVSYFMLHAQYPTLWWKLATIISCGTVAAAIIPELTRLFTSTRSAHCREVVNASTEGGAGLTILSGLVAGNFSCFWMGLTLCGLMLTAYLTSQNTLVDYMSYPAVFAFGLVAFGMLGMGPVTIAVDSYGPVADNAQSVFELSTIEQMEGIEEEIAWKFGFNPDFEKGKLMLEDNDGAGNTFKATAKPMLIGTAVVGATTMIFSLILMLKRHFGWTDLSSLSIVDARIILGILAGGSVVYWFCGASRQAVTTGAFRAVDYIKKNIRLTGSAKASSEDSNEVVRICTKYAQYGMVNIFGVVFSLALAFACFDAVFFVGYLISIAMFGLFMAINMANAGGCWDNAKKIVEVELRRKGTPLHAATVIGDIVGDPFKDTSSVALNPIIKFTTLFGLLAVEIAVNTPRHIAVGVGIFFLISGLIFAYRSFYGMRISHLDPASYILESEQNAAIVGLEPLADTVKI